MYHERHCLRMLWHALNPEATQGNLEVSNAHAQHCLNYLRQMILCESNMRLEPLVDGEKTDGLGLEHTCRDWTVLYDYAEENYKGWPEEL